jgi:PAS domain S-box-containing protein
MPVSVAVKFRNRLPFFMLAGYLPICNYGVIRTRHQIKRREEGMNSLRGRVKWVVLLALLSLLAGSAGYYHMQKQRRFEVVAESMATFAQLKLHWIQEWRTSRLNEGSFSMASRFYGPMAERWATETPSQTDIEAVLSGFQTARSHRGYSDALFVDTAGNRYLSLNGGTGHLHPESMKGLREAFRLNAETLTDLYADPEDSSTMLDLVIPYFMDDHAGTPAGAIIFRYDARQALYPIILSWPEHSDSAEILLVREDGDSFLYLNEPRHRKDIAFVSQPVHGSQDILAVRAVEGEKGLVTGRDYRGVNVVAFVEPVPGTSWRMIVKKDEAEIFAPLRRELFFLTAVSLLLAVSVSGLLVMLWQRRDREHLQAMFGAETERRKDEIRFRAMLDNMLEGCQIIDFEWRHVYINDLVLKYSGRRREEMIGHTLMESYPGIDKSAVFAMFQRCMTDRVPQHLPSVAVDYDDGTRWYEISVQPVPQGIFVLTNDITDRKRAEMENARLASAIEQLGEVVIILGPDKKVQYVNPAFESITGFRPEEVVGSPLPVTGMQDEKFYRVFWETLDSGRTWTGRLVSNRKDGTLYTEDAVVTPISDASGAIVNYVSITRDITGYLELQAEKEKLQEQYLQAQKMESVGRLAGGVAHDFNNMLNVIMGHAQLSLDLVGSAQPLAHHVEEINKAARRSAELTKQLLTFARKQAVSPRVLNLNTTIGGLLSMLQRIIGENIDLSWLPGQDLWPVRIDPSQVDQLLANLTINARDAITGQGRITIETGNVVMDEDCCSEHLGTVPGEYVRLTLSDTGCGMEKEVRAHLFEPFFTTKEIGKGTGLGLSTVYGIVSQNEGLITIYSEPGKGSTFRIYFPRHTGPDTGRKTAAAAEKTTGGNETVLLVEDEAAVMNLARLMLKRLGYTVIAADTPRDALLQAEKHAGAIDLLLVDVVMPEMTGRDLADRLTGMFPCLKCLFMSGYTADIIAHHGVLDEGVNFIQKPFTSSELAAKVREALAWS